jgi:glycosyltransferase involved in cell wall biosynthesis
VLFVTESFLPVLGGGEQHIALLATRLAARGAPPTVITRRTEASWPEMDSQAGAEVVRVAPAGRGRGGKYRMVPAAMAAVRRLGGAHEVVVVRGTRVLGLPAVRAARRVGRPLVLQPEVNGELSGAVYLWGTALDRAPFRQVVSLLSAERNRVLKRADAFVAMSRQIRDECVDAGMPSDRVHLIPHGVDTRRFAPADSGERASLRKRLGLPEDAVIVANTGRLLRGKGLDVLLDAFAPLTRDIPHAHLLIVGSGDGQPLSVEEDLRRRVETEGLGARVTFTGRVDAVEDWLRASDIFAFPSLFEGLGLSLLEAAACGLPTVGSRTGGIVDVIDDARSGFLVPPGDGAALGQTLRVLVEDGGSRTALGAEARRIACARFDVEAMFERYLELFTRLSTKRPETA